MIHFFIETNSGTIHEVFYELIGAYKILGEREIHKEYSEWTNHLVYIFYATKEEATQIYIDIQNDWIRKKDDGFYYENNQTIAQKSYPIKDCRQFWIEEWPD